MRYPGLPAFPAIGNPDFLASFPTISCASRSSGAGRGDGCRRGESWTADSVTKKSSASRLRAQSGRRRLRRRFQAAPLGSRECSRRATVVRCRVRRCHGERGEGKEGPALNNRVFLDLATDTYLVKTIRSGRRGTSMAGFGTSSTVHGALTDSEIESVIAFLRTWEGKK